jgi:hypothetical protein
MHNRSRSNISRGRASPSKNSSSPSLTRMKTENSKVKVYLRVKPFVQQDKHDEPSIDVVSSNQV